MASPWNRSLLSSLTPDKVPMFRNWKLTDWVSMGREGHQARLWWFPEVEGLWEYGVETKPLHCAGGTPFQWFASLPVCRARMRGSAVDTGEATAYGLLGLEELLLFPKDFPGLVQADALAECRVPTWRDPQRGVVLSSWHQRRVRGRLSRIRIWLTPGASPRSRAVDCPWTNVVASEQAEGVSTVWKVEGCSVRGARCGAFSYPTFLEIEEKLCEWFLKVGMVPEGVR